MATHRIRARQPDRVPAPPVDRDPDALAAVRRDAGHHPGGHAAGVVRPCSEAEAAAAIRAAARVLPIGAQSSLTGGATPAGEVVLATDRMPRILHIDAGDGAGRGEVTAEAGAPLTALQEALRGAGAWYPPVPTFDGACAGGVVATNAAGAATFKYGATRAWVRGLTVVLASGEVLDLRRGETRAHPDGYFEVLTADGARRVPAPSYRMPKVAKCSAGYFARPGMDLIDLFIGSEGTLGVITAVTFATVAPAPAVALVWAPAPTEGAALALAGALRDAARRAWRDGPGHGVNVAAIEHLDARSLDIVREDGVARRRHVSAPPGAAAALLVQVEWPAGAAPDAATAWAEIAAALDRGPQSGAPDTQLARLCRLLADASVLDDAEIALPTNRRRQADLLAVREAVPEGVNRRIGDAARRLGPGVAKTAADMIVPFERLAESLARFRAAFDARGLDYAIWGHLSDGNVHPNVIPRSAAEAARGREAILECGRAVVALGGSPLAEHGVGRNPVKQALLRQLYGDAGVVEMRAVKAALDPQGKLAPGVLFPARPV